jgi:hypothetical protein
MTYSELRVRIILALALLFAGLLVVRSKATGIKIQQTQASPSGKALAAPNEVTRLEATDPAQFRLASGQNQIVMIFAPWDKISHDSAQLMHTFEERYRGMVLFSYLDISDARNWEIMEKLNNEFYPQFAYLDAEGNILAQWTTPSAHEMTMAIEKSRLQVPLW